MSFLANFHLTLVTGTETINGVLEKTSKLGLWGCWYNPVLMMLGFFSPDMVLQFLGEKNEVS